MTKLALYKSLNFRKSSISLFFCAAIFSFIAGTNSIQNSAEKLDNKPTNDLREIADPLSAEGWYKFKLDVSIKPDLLFTEYKEAFGLGRFDKMIKYHQESDELGYVHHRYEQTYKGIKVEGCEYIIHEKNERSVIANGKMVLGLDLGVSTSISKNEALITALNYINADKYFWEDNLEEQLLKEIKNDEEATFYPNPELLITNISDVFDLDPSNFRLTFKLSIASLIPFDANAVYVDAVTGKVIKVTPLISNCNPPTQCNSGNACTLYNTQQTISTECTVSNGYRLFDDCRSDNILARVWIVNGYQNIYDTDNNWTAPDCHLTQGFWGAEMTYDYFLTQHGRDSYDGNGGRFEIRTNHTIKNNAFWFLFSIFIGQGQLPEMDPTDWVNSLEVMGHEFGHGVNATSANLSGSGESGALSESFSDIWGTLVEHYAQGLYEPSNPGDWTILEDFWIPNGKARDMADPKSVLDPDTYLGQYWVPGATHDNNGVQNKWFYLLANGGSGTNDNGSDYNLTGITKEKAADIAYRNLTVYLTSTSNYYDSRMGSMLAAEDLFGICSVEALETADAWYAVGVGNSKAGWPGSAGGEDDDFNNGMEVDDLGNNYIIGTFGSTATFERTTLISLGFSDIYVAKYKDCGTLDWIKQIGNTWPQQTPVNAGNEDGTGIAVDANGNVYVCGMYTGTITIGTTVLTSFPDIYADIFVAKFDANGNSLWAKSCGGTFDGDAAYDIDIDNTGNVYITGQFFDNFTFGSTVIGKVFNDAGTIFVAKYDNNGNEQWIKHASDNLTAGAGGTGSSLGVRTLPAGDVEVYVTGWFFDDLTIKTDPSTSLSLIKVNNTYDMFIAKFHGPTGTILWLKGTECLGHLPENPPQLAVDDNVSEFFITGSVASSCSTFTVVTITKSILIDTYMFVAKMDASGNIYWVETGTSSFVGDIAQQGTNAYLTGLIRGGSPSTTLSLGGLSVINSSGFNNIFVASMDQTGTANWLIKADGNDHDQGKAIDVDLLTNVFLSGEFSGRTNFGGLDPLNAQPPGSGYGHDIFMSRVNPTGTFFKDSPDKEPLQSNIANLLNDLNIYPNPFNSTLTINYELIDDGIVSAVIYNLFGQEIKKLIDNNYYTKGTYQMEFDTGDFGEGIYIISLKQTSVDNNITNQVTKKLVKIN
ncbi:MAG: M4 family metallopeptidase [Bacteroidetes bacterium]|nr:M4 family metallopeptidase [Bacteroidota bacterium]